MGFIFFRFLLVRISLFCKMTEQLKIKVPHLTFVNPLPFTSKVSLSTIFVADSVTPLTSQILGTLGLSSTKLMKFPLFFIGHFSFDFLSFSLKRAFKVIFAFSFSLFSQHPFLMSLKRALQILFAQFHKILRFLGRYNYVVKS